MGTNIFLIFNRYMIIKFMSDPNWKKKKNPSKSADFFFPYPATFSYLQKRYTWVPDRKPYEG